MVFKGSSRSSLLDVGFGSCRYKIHRRLRTFNKSEPQPKQPSTLPSQTFNPEPGIPTPPKSPRLGTLNPELQDTTTKPPKSYKNKPRCNCRSKLQIKSTMSLLSGKSSGSQLTPSCQGEQIFRYQGFGEVPKRARWA